MNSNDMQHAAVPDEPAKAGMKEWIGLAVLTLPVLLLSLDVSVLYLAIPHMAKDLQPDSTQLLWIMDMYGFMIAGFLVTMGTLGDRIGRRRLLLIGATVFAIASVMAAFSKSAEMLIAARALLGVAGATQMPSTLALIGNMFRNPRERSSAIGIWMSCFMVGSVIGPLVGGLMLEFFHWSSVFLLAVPVMVLLLATGPFLLPEFRDHTAGRIDALSVALSLAAILPVVYGLKETAKYGLEGGPLASMAIGLVFGVVFVRRQLKLADPMFDLSLFRSVSFCSSLAIMALTAFMMGGVMLFFAQYLQVIKGLSPVEAGLWMIPAAIAMLVGCTVSPLIARRLRPGIVIGLGLVVSVFGFLLLTRLQADSGLATVIIGMVVLHIGLAPSAVLITDLVVGSAPPEKTGSASALNETSGEMGIALGVAALGSIGTAIYRGKIDADMPDDVPPATAEAARDTVVGAVAAAERLPGELAGELVQIAQGAFMAGFHTVAGVGAVVVAILAGGSFILLRSVRPSGGG